MTRVRALFPVILMLVSGSMMKSSAPDLPEYVEDPEDLLEKFADSCLSGSSVLPSVYPDERTHVLLKDFCAGRHPHPDVRDLPAIDEAVESLMSHMG